MAILDCELPKHTNLTGGSQLISAANSGSLMPTVYMYPVVPGASGH